jgi:hypothetical protein
MQGLILIASLGFLIALYYAIMLSRETKHERYWLMLGISALFLAIHEWTLIPWQFHLIDEQQRLMIAQIASIIGAVTFGYAVYGLATSMRKIRERLE